MVVSTACHVRACVGVLIGSADGTAACSRRHLSSDEPGVIECAPAPSAMHASAACIHERITCIGNAAREATIRLLANRRAAARVGQSSPWPIVLCPLYPDANFERTESDK